MTYKIVPRPKNSTGKFFNRMPEARDNFRASSLSTFHSLIHDPQINRLAADAAQSRPQYSLQSSLRSPSLFFSPRPHDIPVEQQGICGYFASSICIRKRDEKAEAHADLHRDFLFFRTGILSSAAGNPVRAAGNWRRRQCTAAAIITCAIDRLRRFVALLERYHPTTLFDRDERARTSSA